MSNKEQTAEKNREKKRRKKIPIKLIIEIVLGVLAFIGIVLNFLDNKRTKELIEISRQISDKEIVVLSTTIENILKIQSELFMIMKYDCDENKAIANNIQDKINSGIDDMNKMRNGLCETSIKIIDTLGGQIPNVRLSISGMPDTITDVNGNIRLWMKKNANPLGRVRIQATKNNYEPKTVHERICKEIVIKLNLRH
jgi:hypothetical protein